MSSRIPIASAALLAALLAGCGGGESDNMQAGANRQEERIRIANPTHDGLTELPPNLQRLYMLRAIRSSGARCQRVDNAGYQEEYRNMRMWVARCDVEGQSFAVYIGADGSVQARNCAEAGTLALPRCQPLPPPVPDPTAPVIKEGAADNAFRSNSF